MRLPLLLAALVAGGPQGLVATARAAAGEGAGLAAAPPARLFVLGGSDPRKPPLGKVAAFLAGAGANRAPSHRALRRRASTSF
jgi:hypothetical protein